MSEQNGRQLLLGMFFLSLAVVAWDEIKHGGVMPRPRRFIGAGVVFGILGLAAPFISYKLAGIFGAGMLLALMYKGVINMGPAATGAVVGGIPGGLTPSE